MLGGINILNFYGFNTGTLFFNSIIEMQLVPGINLFTCFLIMLCLGAISAIITKTLAAPIERIKLIQQCRYKEEEAEKTIPRPSEG